MYPPDGLLKKGVHKKEWGDKIFQIMDMNTFTPAGQNPFMNRYFSVSTNKFIMNDSIKPKKKFSRNCHPWIYSQTLLK